MSLRSILRLCSCSIFVALFCGTLAAQSKPLAGQFSQLPKRGIAATDLTTTQGSDIPVRSTMFETPPDLNDMISGKIPYDYDYEAIATSSDFTFEQIKSITVQKSEREWIESDADQIETLDLGPMGRAIPPPPDWQRTYGNQPAWTRAKAVRPGALVPYVNRGGYIWSTEEATAEPREILLRQSFEPISAHEIMSATLRIAGRVEVVSASLNDHPIHLAGDTEFGFAEFEVSSLIQSGQNILALWVRPQIGDGAKVEPPAIAWHLELHRLRGRDEKFRNQWGQALVVTLDGDRVWGTIESVGETALNLETEYGAYEADWNLIETVLFPRSWTDIKNPKTRGMAYKISDWWNERGKPRLTEASGVGLPLRLAPRSLAGHLLLTEGRAIAGRPASMSTYALELIDDRGQKSSVRPDEVFAIHPPNTGIPPMQKPKPELAHLYCRVSTYRGERISGLLRQMNRSGLVLEAPGGDFLKIPSRSVLEVSFPYHGVLGEKAAPLPADSTDNHQIGILGRAQGADEVSTDFDRINARFQHAAFLASLSCSVVPQPMMTDSVRLSPEVFPILACLDPLGEYLDSLESEGDVRTVLRQYVERGGTLLLFSRGGALRTAVRTSPDGMVREPSTDGLARDLGLRIALPGDPVPPGFSPFDRPPNQLAPLEFSRALAFASDLTELPASIDLGCQMLAPFYPMVSTASQEEATIYELRMQDGTRFGPALQAAPAGQGRVLIVDHLLWSSRADGQPFETAVLPVLLKWAFKK